ncbi:MAG: GT-D fold domain-containing glycosyltransferase [Paenibacillus macerans]|nr:GT-D fold domain-containing glycosyltransferase [Paenibacillus macerans]MCY7558279.1 GT-D fold domain-containing glycosyltransferase [Paenibacillus macerans]MDU7476536.1 GT-D fold domain-containing glycosyltransferase [Paenibacillus macerans]
MAHRAQKAGLSRKTRTAARRAAGAKRPRPAGRRGGYGRYASGKRRRTAGRGNAAARRTAAGQGAYAPQPAKATAPPPPSPSPKAAASFPAVPFPAAESAAELSPAPGSAEFATREEAYAAGYREGLFAGGEAKLERLIPRHMMLPELTVDDVIAAGFHAVAGALSPLLRAADVFAAAERALSEGRPLSIVRLGDGEMLTLAHDTVLPVEEAMRWGAFLPYAGVQLPDPAAREALVAAVRAAGIIGIPQSRHPSYQGLLFPVFRHYGIDYRTLQLTTSTINYELNEEGYFARLLKGRRVLLIGDKAFALARVLRLWGADIAGSIAPVNGVGDVPRVMELARGIPFDLALAAAGIAAVILCERLAREHGKVTLDLGHLANKLISGEAVMPPIQEV